MPSTSTQDVPTSASISPSQAERDTPVNNGRYPSHIRQRESVGIEEDGAGSREEGYDGDRVRLLVGRWGLYLSYLVVNYFTRFVQTGDGTRSIIISTVPEFFYCCTKYSYAFSFVL